MLTADSGSVNTWESLSLGLGLEARNISSKLETVESLQFFSRRSISFLCSLSPYFPFSLFSHCKNDYPTRRKFGRSKPTHILCLSVISKATLRLAIRPSLNHRYWPQAQEQSPSNKRNLEKTLSTRSSKPTHRE